MQEIFAVSLFALVLLLIALELVNRMVAALLGAAVLISLGIVTQEQAASEFVDWNTIGLLAGMMVIVAILERTGVFEYLAIKSAQWGKRSEEHTSELQSRQYLVCRLLLEKKK